MALGYLSKDDSLQVEAVMKEIHKNPWNPGFEQVELLGKDNGYAVRVSPKFRLLYRVEPHRAPAAEVSGDSECAAEITIEDIVSERMLQLFKQQAHEAA